MYLLYLPPHNKHPRTSILLKMYSTRFFTSRFWTIKIFLLCEAMLSIVVALYSVTVLGHDCHIDDTTLYKAFHEFTRLFTNKFVYLSG